MFIPFTTYIIHIHYSSGLSQVNDIKTYNFQSFFGEHLKSSDIMRFLILLGLVIVLTSALGEERELGGLEENQLVDADRRMTSEYIYYEFTYLLMNDSPEPSISMPKVHTRILAILLIILTSLHEFFKGPAICKDNFRRCKILKRRGGCRRYRFWMKKNCMASCKYCNKGSRRPKSQSFFICQRAIEICQLYIFHSFLACRYIIYL